MKYIYSDNDGALDSWQGPYELDHQLDGETNTRFNPYGHIVDVGNNTLYQTWFGGVSGNPLSLYRIYLYKSTDGGLTFPTIISVTPDPPNPDQRRPWGEPSLVNVGGGCFLLLAKKNDDFNRFIQYKSENNCVTWIEQGTANFGESQLGDYAAPPFLSFINYEGVGIVACYYTNRGTKELKVIFGLAKDLLEGPGGWNNSTIKLVLDYETVEPPYCADRCGYQSFFLPLNQYKGIGVTFFEKYDDVAYPIIVFTNVLGMKDILVALGL